MNDPENAFLTKKWGWLKALIHKNVVQPFTDSRDPVPEVALGASVGAFLGFTPTVGIQMPTVLMIWFFFRFVFRIRFNMIIGMAMVWVSNPLTMIPMYYGFLVTGNWMQEMAGIQFMAISYAAFTAEFERLNAMGDMSFLIWLYHAAQVLIMEFGWPMVLGSLIYAIPAAIIAYPLTGYWVLKYRKHLAVVKGIGYQEWRARYERSPD